MKWNISSFFDIFFLFCFQKFWIHLIPWNFNSFYFNKNKNRIQSRKQKPERKIPFFPFGRLKRLKWPNRLVLCRWSKLKTTLHPPLFNWNTKKLKKKKYINYNNNEHREEVEKERNNRRKKKWTNYSHTTIYIYIQHECWLRSINSLFIILSYTQNVCIVDKYMCAHCCTKIFKILLKKKDEKIHKNIKITWNTKHTPFASFLDFFFLIFLFYSCCWI